MKKYHIFNILFTLSVVFLSSCDKYLDINPDNRAEMDTKTKIAGMLVSAYPTYSYYFLSEMSSDNADRMDSRIQYDNRRQSEFFYWEDVREVSTDTPQTIWEAHYSAIASANHALAAIEKVGNSDGSLNPQKGEALLCRAYGHFVLVNLFCKHYCTTSANDLGVPFMDAPETTVNPQYDRGTVAEVYAKIEADIEEALPLIRDDEYTNPKYHFNKKAAHAFAARFYLYYRKYDKVITNASATLGADPLKALRDWQYAGRTQTLDIRGNEFVDSDNKANLLLIPAFSLWGRHNIGSSSTGSYYSHNTQISTRETDQSVGPWGSSTSTFYFKSVAYTSLKITNGKIKEFFEYTDQVQGIGYAHIVQPVFTSDETLLCRAEAFALLKDYDNAVKDLAIFMKNYSTGTILTRENIKNFYGGLKYYTYDDKDDEERYIFTATPKKRLNPDFNVDADEQENLIHCILHIRRILTQTEGLRWFDIKRYGIEIYRRAITGNNEVVKLDILPVNDLRRAIQLPQDVINAGLPPNPRNNNK